MESGRCVAEALTADGFDVITSDVGPDDLGVLELPDVDVFFLALHGEFGEDGQLQQILEDRRRVYTGSGPEASGLAFDKVASKRLFERAGVKVAPSVEFGRGHDARELDERLEAMGERFVVKPVYQGSSVGVYVVEGRADAIAAARTVGEEFGDGMIEAFISGQEITVGVVGRTALPIIEIRSKTGFYDYQAKYVDEQTEYLFDTVDDASVRQRVAEAALACFDALGCRHFARVDFILTGDGDAYALEVNTIPGFTTHSLLPKAAAKTGCSMGQLCARIVRAAHAEQDCKVK